MDDYQIALSPGLGISASEFVAAWNSTSECRALAEARLAEPTRATFDPLADLFALLVGLASGVASNEIHYRIRKALAKQDFHRETEMMLVESPDGTKVVYVKIKE